MNPTVIIDVQAEMARLFLPETEHAMAAWRMNQAGLPLKLYLHERLAEMDLARVPAIRTVTALKSAGFDVKWEAGYFARDYANGQHAPSEGLGEGVD